MIRPRHSYCQTWKYSPARV